MQRLSHSDIANLMEQMRQVYAVTDMDRFPIEILAMMRRLVPCDSDSFDDLNPEKQRIVGVTWPSEARCPKYSAALEQHMHEHPGIVHYYTTGDQSTCKISDFVSREEWHSRGVYQEYYRHAAVEDQMGFWLAFPKPHMLTIVFNRSRRTFSERDRAVLNLMRPHLVQAYHNAEAFTEARRSHQMLLHLMEESGRGVILLNQELQLRSLTTAAQTWMARYFPAWRRAPMRLPEAILRWLANDAATLTDDQPPPPHKPMIVQQGQNRLEIRVAHEQDGRCILLMDERRGDPGPAVQKDAAQLAGLPPRLHRILQALLAGGSEKQIAAELELSRHTVHQYVKMLYAHLGVGSRGELMARWVKGKSEVN